jgi:hypothetical protein
VDRVPPDRRAPLTARLAPSRPDHAAIVAAHEAALAHDDDGYLDPATGAFVFTAQAHWDRGSCCHSGCRHCPYEDGERAGTSAPSAGQLERGTE